jgi:hypothetical protein
MCDVQEDTGSGDQVGNSVPGFLILERDSFSMEMRRRQLTVSSCRQLFDGVRVWYRRGKNS